MNKYSLADLRQSLKPVDSWWTVLIVDPFAVRITLWLANHTALSANVFTLLTLLLSLYAGFLFSRGMLVFGAIAYEAAFLFDCIDGKLAILKKTGSDLGAWFDSVSDKIRLIACSAGLAVAYPEGSVLMLVFVGLYLWDETESLLFSSIVKDTPAGPGQAATDPAAPLPIRVRGFLKKRRIAGPLTLVEQDTALFFVMPLLGLPILGMKIAIAMNLIGRATTIVHFWFWRYRRRI